MKWEAYNTFRSVVLNNWRVSEDFGEGVQRPIAIVSDQLSGDKQVEYARLIAAAPDLLAALEYIVNDSPRAGEDAELTAQGYNLACAAIAKAKGQSAPCGWSEIEGDK